ncbi:hypothetical protein V6N13_140992 [Hibiscus sabdariffa]
MHGPMLPYGLGKECCPRRPTYYHNCSRKGKQLLLKSNHPSPYQSFVRDVAQLVEGLDANLNGGQGSSAGAIETEALQVEDSVGVQNGVVTVQVGDVGVDLVQSASPKLLNWKISSC